MVKVESNLKKALGIISVSNETDGVSTKIRSKQYSQEISLALNSIFGEEVCAITKKYEIDMEGRSYLVTLVKNNSDSGHDISIVENTAGMSIRELKYGFNGDDLCDLGVGYKEIHILNKFAVCEVVKECANEEQIRKYEKSIRDIFDQVDDTFSFLNESNQKGSVNKKFDKPSGDILVKLGGGNDYIFPKSKKEKAYTLDMGHDSSGELQAISKPLELFTYKKIFDELYVAVNKNKLK